ncbi:MAG TPA: hypothetical protein VGP76_03850 [Planctomycetaceae bacterium]|nr:hypothetical protein [Planctomycetaceae bacterium]
MTYADQTGHTAHWNKLCHHWTKKVELDRNPQNSGPEKASCTEQQCYRLFDTQRLDERIDWIHCGFPEGDRTVRERRSPIVSSTGLRRLPFLTPPLPGGGRILVSPQSASMLAVVGLGPQRSCASHPFLGGWTRRIIRIVIQIRQARNAASDAIRTKLQSGELVSMSQVKSASGTIALTTSSPNAHAHGFHDCDSGFAASLMPTAWDKRVGEARKIRPRQIAQERIGLKTRLRTR